MKAVLLSIFLPFVFATPWALPGDGELGGFDVGDQQIMRIPMRRKARPVFSELHHHPPPNSNGSFAVNTTAFLLDLAYGVQVWMGNPGQEVIVDLDSGSSEFWVDPACSSYLYDAVYQDLCRSLGVYLPQQSSTAKNMNVSQPNSWIYYGSGSVLLQYFRDDISFTDPYMFWRASRAGKRFNISQAMFGLGKSSYDMPSGIMGTAYGKRYNQNYSGIIDEMHEQGVIKDKDFSVALGSVNETDGEIIFGGIDKAKFAGSLYGLPISKQLPYQDDGFYRYWVNLTYVGLTAPGSCLSQPLVKSSFEDRFLPDTGTTLTYLPVEAFDGLLEHFPDARMVWDYGYVVNCSHLHEPGTVDFGTPDFTIRVPYRDFIFQMPAEKPAKGVTCILGAVPSHEFYILGDTFLRAAHVTFRQQEHMVYFGQYTNCGINITSSHHAIADIEGDCSEDDQFARLYGDPTNPAAASATMCSTISTGTYVAPTKTQERAVMTAFTPRIAMMGNRDGKQEAGPAPHLVHKRGFPQHDQQDLRDRTVVLTIVTTETIRDGSTHTQPHGQPSDTAVDCTSDTTESETTLFEATSATSLTRTERSSSLTVEPFTLDSTVSFPTLQSVSGSGLTWSRSLTATWSVETFSWSSSSQSLPWWATSDCWTYTSHTSHPSHPSHTRRRHSWTSDGSSSSKTIESPLFTWPTSLPTDSDTLTLRPTDTADVSVTDYSSAWPPSSTEDSSTSGVVSWQSGTYTDTDMSTSSAPWWETQFSDFTPSTTVPRASLSHLSHRSHRHSSATSVFLSVPLTSPETVVVQLPSTTYTIVDGSTATPTSTSTATSWDFMTVMNRNDAPTGLPVPECAGRTRCGLAIGRVHDGGAICRAVLAKDGAERWRSILTDGLEEACGITAWEEIRTWCFCQTRGHV